MTFALLLAATPDATGGCAALLTVDREPAVRRLVRQLRAHDVERIGVVALPEWSDDVRRAVEGLGAEVIAAGTKDLVRTLDVVARRADEPVVVAHADVVCHDHAIGALLLDPRVGSGVLTTRAPVDGDPFHVRMVRGRVVSAESPFHAVRGPTTQFLSLLLVGRDQLDAMRSATSSLVDATSAGRPAAWDDELARKVEEWGHSHADVARRKARHLADQLDRVGPGEVWRPTSEPIREELDRDFERDVLGRARRSEHDVVALLLMAMTRHGAVLRSAYLRDLHWARPVDQAAADATAASLAAVDEDKVLLDSAVKSDDGFFTTFLVSPYSKYIARWTARHGLTPNQVTSFSLVLSIVAAVAFATGTTAGNVAGAVLLQISFTFDCVDGQLARFSRQFSTLGAWLDSVFDRAKEAVVMVGLAFGALAVGDDVWLLACVAFAFQAIRHLLDFSWAAHQHTEIAAVELFDVRETADRRGAPRPRGWIASEQHAHDFLAVEAAIRDTAVLDEFDQGDLDRGHLDQGGAPIDVDDGGRDASPRHPARHRPARRTAVLGVARTVGGFTGRVLGATRDVPVVHWAKKMIVLPIGERLALISITAVLGGPRLVFVSLIVWGGVAALYMLGGRVLRSLT